MSRDSRRGIGAAVVLLAVAVMTYEKKIVGLPTRWTLEVPHPSMRPTYVNHVIAIRCSTLCRRTRRCAYRLSPHQGGTHNDNQYDHEERPDPPSAPTDSLSMGSCSHLRSSLSQFAPIRKAWLLSLKSFPSRLRENFSDFHKHRGLTFSGQEELIGKIADMLAQSLTFPGHIESRDHRWARSRNFLGVTPYSFLKFRTK